MPEKIMKEFADVDVILETDQRKTGYYKGLVFHLYASPDGEEEIELMEGGDTDWTQKLLNNAKERLVISGIGSERVCEFHQ